MIVDVLLLCVVGGLVAGVDAAGVVLGVLLCMGCCLLFVVVLFAVVLFVCCCRA